MSSEHHLPCGDHIWHLWGIICIMVYHIVVTIYYMTKLLQMDCQKRTPHNEQLCN